MKKRGARAVRIQPAAKALARPSLVRGISRYNFSYKTAIIIYLHTGGKTVNLTFCQLSFLARSNSLLKIGSSMEKIKREEKEILMKAKGREMESSVPFIRDKWLKWIFFLIYFSFFAPLFLSLLLLLLFPFSSSLSTQPLE